LKCIYLDFLLKADIVLNKFHLDLQKADIAMDQIPHYTLLEKIGEGPQSVIYKGYYKNMPHRLLTIKLIKSSLLSESQKKYFRQKIEHLKVLPDERLMPPLTFHDSKELQYITRLYFDGIPLDRWATQQGEVKLGDFLTIAMSLSDLLDKTHTAGIIHGGIKPHNILVDPKTLEVRIVDFITPLDVRNVSHFIYDKRFIEGTLAYTSPEQTGRINHRVEFTTDIYSLGVVFYELLTKKLPFSTNDPLELIHSHLAEEAPYVHELNRQIPELLGLIIDKMLLKQPEKRYQGGKGLGSDFLKFKSKYDKQGDTPKFKLGLDDRTHRINFISKMVGRDKEAEMILSDYNEVANGAFKALFISGYSGIGKTRLIQELQKPIVKHQGYFTSGKFDVYQKNIPYSSLIQSFRNLTRTFLTESDERVERWKSKILEAVGNNGRVITDVIPELQVLIGPQQEVRPLPPVESRNRFLDVFGRFLTCLATKESPLVLFIDDLQWCDIASFEFLTSVFENHKEHPYLFLLGAYRHNEVDSSHPLTKLIKLITEEKKPLKELRLGPILDEHSHEMVGYILDSSMEQTQTLAQFIARLTEGNPLFVSESLSYLYNENLLFYHEHNGQWTWNMDQIRNSTMPSTIVALFSSKVHKLPPVTIKLLEFCACMGNLFTPDELALVNEISLLDTFETLKPALGQGLLIENKDQLQFVHDKVQEATLALIDKDRRRKIHWEVGNHLLKSVSPDEPLDKLENIFTIASHLNIAARLAKEKGDAISDDFKNLLMNVNYFAGNSALNSLATEAANEYYSNSRDHLHKDSWSSLYERTYRVYQKLAKTELMVGKYESSEKLLNELLDNAQSDLDKAEALAEQTTSLSSIGNFIKAIETANRGLAYFQKDIPTDSQLARKRCKELMDKIHSNEKDVWSKILHMPFTEERKSKIELAFYSELIPDLYMSGLVDQLYLAAAQSTQHCLAGGMDESVIYSFSIMGLNLGEQHHFQEAFKYEDLAKELSEKYPNTFGSTRGMNGVVWCNMHSRNHAEEIISYCLKGIQSGKNCGDLYNAGLCYGPLMWNMQVKGSRLSEIENYAKECLNFSQKFHLSFSVGLSEAVLAGWVEPMKAGYKPVPMETNVEKWTKSNHIASVGSYFVLLAVSSYYYSDHEATEYYLETVKTYLHGLTDNVLKRQWFIFRMLNSLKLYERKIKYTSFEQVEEFCKPILIDVIAWVELGPLLAPYLKFFQAELSRVKNGFNQSLNLYLETLQVAHEHEYTFLEAYINEVIGHQLASSKLIAARLYLQESGRLYEKIQIFRKLILLSEQYSEFFNIESNNFERVESSENKEIDEKGLALDLDIEYLMKSSLAISAEIDADQLFKKVLNVVLESSGAQYGCIILEKNGDLFVSAESQVKDRGNVQTIFYPLEQSTLICKSIVRYVHRTVENVILHNATEEGLFKDNPEVQEMNLKSVFCLPLIKLSKLVGIIYLENRLVPSVFSGKEVEMTKLLSAQISISLENAKLVDEMRRAEKLIKASLKEKEILLKEVHHRVKNNLQVICSLFSMQSRNVKDPETLLILRESQNRVRSMALVHEKLHQGKDLANVDFAGYIKVLSTNLLRAYGYDFGDRNISLSMDVENISFTIDFAIPLGLILNELLSNALKHAFGNDSKGKIHLIFKRDLQQGTILLSVRDNGKGFPKDLDYRNTKTLGLQLVVTLIEQIGGTMNMLAQDGTLFSMTIPFQQNVVS
jgi:predicted ATPase/two-component sensor histidine kinase